MENLIHSLTGSHASNIETIKRDIDAEREKWEMGFRSVTREREALKETVNQLTGRIAQVAQRVNHNDLNISREY